MNGFEKYTVEFITHPFILEKGSEMHDAIQATLESVIERLADKVGMERITGVSWMWTSEMYKSISDVLEETLNIPLKIRSMLSSQDYRLLMPKIQFCIEMTETVYQVYNNREVNELQRLVDELD